MSNKVLKNKRAHRVRLKLKKSSNLRLSLFRSSKHIYVQLIDDKVGKTLLSASSHDKSLKDSKLKPQDLAYKVGEIVGNLIKDKNTIAISTHYFYAQFIEDTLCRQQTELPFVVPSSSVKTEPFSQQ